nr:hypothetical protein [Friedmanniella luteola]
MLRTAPTPLATPQPTSETTSSGAAGSTLIAPAAGTTASSAKADTPVEWCEVAPPADSRLVPSCRTPPRETTPEASRHWTGWPRRHGTQARRQWEKVQDLIGVGLAEGARLVAGGPGRPDGLRTATTSAPPCWPT